LPVGGASDRAAWRAGREDLRDALGPLVRALVGDGDPQAVEILREKAGRRRLARGRLASGEACFFKHLLAPAGSGWRSAWKHRLGLSPAAREFAALQRLHAAGVAVPEPLALYRFPGGEFVLVTRLIEGVPLRSALRRPPSERRALLAAVGRLVARLHATGYAHRDLHADNLWASPAGPVLIDLPAALPWAVRWLRLRDLGELDMSLAHQLSLADRLRLRAAALGAAPPFSPVERAQLRAVGRASDARRAAHLRSRTRRSLRTGRLYTSLRHSGGRGMRLREADEADVKGALDGSRSADRIAVEHFAPGGAGLRAAWESPAKRAWLAGHGLRVRGVGAPRPLAYLEWRRLGWTRRSAIALERAGDVGPADLGGGAAWLRAVVDLGAALRRDRIDHAALASARPCLTADARLGLSGLERVRFRRRLSADTCARIDAFVVAQLAACDATPAERADALARYAALAAFLPGPPARLKPARS
jgi:hypothetical protein